MNEQGVEFKEHLYIHPFTPSEKGVMMATETKTKHNRTFQIPYEVTNQYVLTWVTG